MIGTYELILIQILNLALFIGYPLLTLIALLHLRKRKMGNTAQAIWALLLFVPYLGPLAFWVVNPGER